MLLATVGRESVPRSLRTAGLLAAGSVPGQDLQNLQRGLTPLRVLGADGRGGQAAEPHDVGQCDQPQIET